MAQFGVKVNSGEPKIAGKGATLGTGGHAPSHVCQDLDQAKQEAPSPSGSGMRSERALAMAGEAERAGHFEAPSAPA